MSQNIDRILSTIECIASSKSLVYYKVGLTCRPKLRRQTYYNIPPHFRHFVILESDLSASQALVLEKAIFDNVKKSNRNCILFKKHAPAHLESYKPSLGGKKATSDERYSLYLAWRAE